MSDSTIETRSNNVKSVSKKERRDFMTTLATAGGVLAAGASVIPLVHSMNPSKEVLASATTEVSLVDIREGQTKTVMWQGKPVFIKHRTEQEIEEARAVDGSDLKDYEEDVVRVQKGKEKWLIVIGVCTHLGCIPAG